MSSRTAFTDEERQSFAAKYSLLRLSHIPFGLPVMLFLMSPYALEYPLLWAAGTVVLGYFYFCYTSCFHECAHQSLTGIGWFDVWFGKFIGTASLVPYTCYREAHIRHHAYLNRPEDWELWPYSDPKTSTWFRRIFAWMELVLGIFGPPITYGRIYWHPKSPLKEDAKREVRNEYIMMVLFWGTVFGLCTYFDQWGMYFRAWFIPYCVAGFFQSIRKFTEHLGMASYDPMLGTRTVVGKNWYTRLCTYLNFDIFVHGPHHRHPKVAHDKLKIQMQNYLDKNPDTDFPVFRTYTGAALDMVPSLIKNPGVGMNVGAPPPGECKQKVRDFVTDVSEEVLPDNDRVVVGAK
ncbi:fatty acid desaturase family protein [Stratiformator vulcanicus]|uniref:Delta(12)-fatty-acid desaturase n=1 Tax=Stratiformator vulcanicus TaxID=2527980 RepID=A0A517R7F5_9PLAN|nr:fatty acid desaturase [Stratiformator vulcanicus]QDT39792.1 Delta(12)-fatty-acid desaturase [Stratiformator vulcanicus]